MTVLALFDIELTVEELLAEDGPLWPKADHKTWPSYEAWRDAHGDPRWCMSCFPRAADLRAVGADPSKFTDPELFPHWLEATS